MAKESAEEYSTQRNVEENKNAVVLRKKMKTSTPFKEVKNQENSKEICI